jgi:lysozyme family protein
VISALGHQDPKRVVNAICDERLEFLQGLRTWSVFGNGWGRRVGEVRAAALAMADKLAPDRSRQSGARGPAPDADRGPVVAPPPEPAPRQPVGAKRLAWGAAFVALVGAAAHGIADHPVLVASAVVVAAVLAFLFVKTGGNGD